TPQEARKISTAWNMLRAAVLATATQSRADAGSLSRITTANSPKPSCAHSLGQAPELLTAESLGLVTKAPGPDLAPIFKHASAPLVGSTPAFFAEVRKPDVASAIVEVDSLVARLFAKHFGDPTHPSVKEDYLEAVFRFTSTPFRRRSFERA